MHLWTIIALALGAGGGGNRFHVVVPPNNDNVGREVALIVTATQDGTLVDIVDDDADGDSDDTALGVPLDAGQSYVLWIEDGAVDDDAGGAWDGDYFEIDASDPVLVQQVTRSDWQHDWVPSIGNAMSGRAFTVFSPRTAGGINDINVIAHEAARVEIYDVTGAPQLSTGTTDIVYPGDLLLSTDLDAGEDLYTRNGLGRDLLVSGHTYEVRSSGNVVVQYGALKGRARDGGGFVPSTNGTTTGDLFYTTIPHDSASEKELRIVSATANTTVEVAGWNEDAGAYEVFHSAVLDRGDSMDLVGRTNTTFRNYDLYRVSSLGGSVNVFEANWMETGAAGTSDMMSGVSGLDGGGAATEFVAYVGPPGRQSNVVGQGGTYSHLYATGYGAESVVRVVDANTGGTLLDETLVVPPSGYADLRIDGVLYAAMNQPDLGLRPYVIATVEQGPGISLTVTNHNDNWMTYMTSVLPAVPAVSVDLPAQVACGEETRATVTMTNDGTLGDLNAPRASLRVPEGIDVTSAPSDLGDGSVLFGSTGQVVEWGDGSGVLAAGASLTFEANLDVTCLSTTGRALDNGALMDLVASASVDDGVQVFGTNSATSAEVYDELGTTVTAHSALASDRFVQLYWATAPEFNLEGFQILRATSLDGTPTPVDGGFVPSAGDSEDGFTYTWTDPDVENGQEYYYWIVTRYLSGVEGRIGPVFASPSAVVQPVTFTGDVTADFHSLGRIFPDPGGSGPGGDVVSGIDAVSGNDFRGIALAYEGNLDVLYVGIDMHGICGDADGDGDPDRTSAALADAGGTDAPRFALDETFTLVLDVDNDGLPDVVAGTPIGRGLGQFRLSEWREGFDLTAPSLAFGKDLKGSGVLLNSACSADSPDLQFAITHFSQLTGNQAPEHAFGVHAFVGAMGDDPIGEDWFPEQGAFQVVTIGELDDALNPWLGPLVAHGDFAVFGNYFSGTPDFAFLPLGFDVDGETVLRPTLSPGSPAYTSPMYFGNGEPTELVATCHPDDFVLGPEETSRVSSVAYRDVVDGAFVTIFEESHSHTVPQTDAQGVAMESIDIQTFRVVRLPCPHIITAEQTMPIGDMLGDRYVALADGSVSTLPEGQVPFTIAHFGIGRFDDNGDFLYTHLYDPSDFLDDWTVTPTAPDFTPLATIDASAYRDETLATDELETAVDLVPPGVVLDAGTWVVNTYLWSYAHIGETTITTTFWPTAACEETP